MNFCAVTDPGKVRKENQDNYRISVSEDKQYCTAVLCDGMGGEQAGSVASTIAVDSFMFHADGIADNTSTAADIRRILTEAVSYANLKVYDRSYTHFECLGMGTTLVSCIITPKRTIIANVGDSRAYHIRANSLYQVTQDHSVISEMVNSGQISAAEAKSHPNRNVITRAVGVEPSVKTDTFEIKLNDGDRLLLCSDGLSNMLSETEILKLSKSCENINELSEELLSAAKDRGAPDNVTMIIIQK